MSFYKIKVYAKLTAVILLFTTILIFMASNRQKVDIKFFGVNIISDMPLFYLIFAVANLGGMVYLVTGKIRKLTRDIKQIRRDNKKRQEMILQVKKDLQQENKQKSEDEIETLN